jgi:hypothetical protein
MRLDFYIKTTKAIVYAGFSAFYAAALTEIQLMHGIPA